MSLPKVASFKNLPNDREPTSVNDLSDIADVTDHLDDPSRTPHKKFNPPGLGTVAPACDPAAWEVKIGESQLEASPGKKHKT
jgi:hypothetical protein